LSAASLAVARALAPVSAIVDRARGGPRTVVWMIGDGRSGSSWVADLLAHTCNYRQLFEPFHPLKVRKFGGYQLNHYQRPGSRNDDLRMRLQDVFAGQVLNRRVNQDANRLLYDGLLVKDVFATLFAAWAVEQFPHVRPVLQIRNPFPVAVSKAKKPKWHWTPGPVELLRQETLVKDHLAPHGRFLLRLEALGDPVLNHLAVWAVLHHCLFRDLDPRQMHIVPYRRILRDPSVEMRRLLAYLGQDDADPKLDPDLLRRAARYSDDANVKRSRERSWTEELTATQIRRGNEVLERFGLHRLFDGVEPAPDFEAVAASLWRGPRQ
jgi:hypothetical protein